MSEEIESRSQTENRPQVPAALRAAGWMIVLAFIAVLLREGRSLFIPLVIAGIGVYFIFILERLILRIRIGNWRLPTVVALIIAFATVIGAGSIIVSIISNNVTYVVRAAPEYQKHLSRLQSDFAERMDRLIEHVKNPLAPILSPSTDNVPPPVPDEATPTPPNAAEVSPVVEETPTPLSLEEAAQRLGDVGDEVQPFAFAKFLNKKIEFADIIMVIVKNLTALIQTTTLILILGIFIFMEAYFVPKKIQALFPDAEKRSHVEKILRRIDGDVQTYFGIKTLISLVTALACYVVMRVVGLDFAEFWALLIFILNFIPAIGSIIATVLPALLALVQFHDSFASFLIVLLGVAAIQIFFGNFLEPNLMGVTLNLSPLVVVLSLITWGLIWGVVGMFLCVPITVIMVIILANFPGTRWIAVLLSRKGDLRL